MSAKSHRDTIAVETATILSHDAWDGAQHIMRLEAPQVATSAEPGSFIHITCDPNRPLRRPISIMRADPRNGWIDILFKVFGEGTALLAQRRPGDRIDLMGPIGVPFRADLGRPRALLIGGGVGIPPMVFLAERMREIGGAFQPFVIMGSEVPFPFRPQPSQIMIPGVPEGAIGAMPLLEEWGIASRLCSKQDLPGAFDGYVTDLARRWLDAMDDAGRKEVAVYACGPHPMLAAVATLAREYQLPCQVSMEEFMACAVGGCAGCVVEVQTPQGPAMKRVCVDGPVFDARQVFPG